MLTIVGAEAKLGVLSAEVGVSVGVVESVPPPVVLPPPDGFGALVATGAGRVAEGVTLGTEVTSSPSSFAFLIAPEAVTLGLLMHR